MAMAAKDTSTLATTSRLRLVASPCTLWGWEEEQWGRGGDGWGRGGGGGGERGGGGLGEGWGRVGRGVEAGWERARGGVGGALESHLKATKRER